MAATPARLVQLILTATVDIGLDMHIIRTFEYFMKPTELLEHIVLTYCAGPGLNQP
jgi:hypothetical protein